MTDAEAVPRRAGWEGRWGAGRYAGRYKGCGRRIVTAACETRWGRGRGARNAGRAIMAELGTGTGGEMWQLQQSRDPVDNCEATVGTIRDKDRERI